MNNLFIDTWGFLCLRDKRERQHKKVSEVFHRLLNQKVKMITTDYILDETFTLLFRKLDPVSAEKSITIILKIIDSGNLIVERITRKRFDNSVELRKKLLDKPDISFTDLTSMVVMKELDITDILSSDSHFQYIGLDFQLVP